MMVKILTLNELDVKEMDESQLQGLADRCTKTERDSVKCTDGGR